MKSLSSGRDAHTNLVEATSKYIACESRGHKPLSQAFIELQRKPMQNSICPLATKLQHSTARSSTSSHFTIPGISKNEENVLVNPMILFLAHSQHTLFTLQ